jgi:hypothetical protein
MVAKREQRKNRTMTMEESATRCEFEMDKNTEKKTPTARQWQQKTAKQKIKFKKKY